MRASSWLRVRTVTLIAVTLGTALLLASPSEATTTRTVTAKANPTAALASHQVTFSGKLSASPTGSSVKIQRYVGSSWVTAKATVTKTGGYYSTKVTLPSTPKAYKFRALAPATKTLALAKSPTVTVTALRKTAFFFGPIYQGDAHVGGDMGVAGSLKGPCTAGAAVALQRKIGTTWTKVGSAATTSQSNVCPFQVTDHNAQSGLYRVLIARKGLNSSVVSSAMQVDPLP